MYKISIGVFGLILAVIFGNAIVVSGQEPEDVMRLPLGKIVIKPPETVEAKRPPSYLTHSRHFGYKCSECHHTWEFDTQIKPCMAAGCHDLTAAPKKSEKSGSDPAQPDKVSKEDCHSPQGHYRTQAAARCDYF